MKIDPHDVGIRVNQAHEFLMEGHKVLIVQNFRGRELQHKHLGDARMKEIITRLSDVSKVETPPRLAGRRMSMILTPDKTKIEAMQRKNGGVKPAAPPIADEAAAPAAVPSTDGAVTSNPAKPKKTPKPREAAPPATA